MTTHKNHDHYVDVLGLHCPQPVITCKAALAKLSRGQVLELAASDHSSLNEIPRLVKFLGDELISIRKEAGHYRYTIKRNSTHRKGLLDDARQRNPAGLEFLLNSLGLNGALEAC